MGPAHYRDLREAYTKRMEVHGLGVALFHPISAADMRPPCAGYFDRNGDWNLICNLLPHDRPPHAPLATELGCEPLDYVPIRQTAINIEWQPKTASGTQEHVLAGNAATPDNLPAGVGAEANVQYTSNSKFGAVLMTKKPIRLNAYNDERLFRSWLDANRGVLYDLHGNQLRKYGLWLVTRVYTCAGASINAWSDNNKASVISTKAKAAMLGELGEELNWNDRVSSRDWSHYNAATDEGLVIFMDGIDQTGFDWMMEGARQKIPGTKSRDRSLSRRRQRVMEDRQRRKSSVGVGPSVAVVTDEDGEQGGEVNAASHGSPPSAAHSAIRASQDAGSLRSRDSIHARQVSPNPRSSNDDSHEQKRVSWYSDSPEDGNSHNPLARPPSPGQRLSVNDAVRRSSSSKRKPKQQDPESLGTTWYSENEHCKTLHDSRVSPQPSPKPDRDDSITPPRSPNPSRHGQVNLEQHPTPKDDPSPRCSTNQQSQPSPVSPETPPPMEPTRSSAKHRDPTRSPSATEQIHNNTFKLNQGQSPPPSSPPIDPALLRDIGLQQPLARSYSRSASPSVRTLGPSNLGASPAISARTSPPSGSPGLKSLALGEQPARSPSLRREVRSVSGGQ